MNQSDLRTSAYNAWDADSSLSPPKTRPGREESAEVAGPELQLLAWSDGLPLFPAALLTRFPSETPEMAKIEELKQAFDLKFPASTQPRPQRGSQARAGGVCDFSLDNGLSPLDFQRTIDLPAVAPEDLQFPRHG